MFPRWRQSPRSRTSGEEDLGNKKSNNWLLRSIHRLRKAKLKTPAVFQNQFRRNGFRRLKVIGDGRCLFRAVIKALSLETVDLFEEDTERASADFLRERTWHSVSFERREEFSEAGVVEGDYDRYIERSRDTSFYGGYPEILAMTTNLERCIQVFMTDSNGLLRNVMESGQQYKSQYWHAGKCQDSVIRLYLSKTHYDLLVPR